MDTLTKTKDEILCHLNDPVEVEKLYREDKVAFKHAFNMLYPTLKDDRLAAFWNGRLNFNREKGSWRINKDLIFIIFACIFAAIIVKLPTFFSIDKEFFYTRNVGFTIFPVLTAYFAWKNKLKAKQYVPMVVATLVAVFFINVFPKAESDTLVLSCIHLVLFFWSILGFSFSSGSNDPSERRLAYLRYNGDLIVMTTLILISGGILTGLTIGLFSLIDLNIEEFYFNNVAIIGLASAPIIGTYLTQSNPELVNRVSPVIAKIFSPLVLLMLVIYLIAILYSGKDPYKDRDFLLMFNMLLIGVIAIIFFSVAESSKNAANCSNLWILFLLSIVTVLVNGLALSAILFRISEWGFTPNRTAVLGSNVLILINLLCVIARFYRVLFKKAEVAVIGRMITAYLPIYVIWTALVTFIFPFIFGFN